MALDDEDKKAIATMIAEQLKASAKATEQTIAKALAGLDLDKRIETLKTELAPKEPEPKDEPPKDGKTLADDPEFKRLKAELETQRKATEAQARRAEEEAKARQAEALQNGVSQALTAAGADPKRVGMALAWLKERGAVKLDERGVPVFTFKRDWGEEAKAAADGGAAEWLGTDDGKFFVPPSQVQGSGDGAGRPGGGGSSGATADPMDILNRALGGVWGG